MSVFSCRFGLGKLVEDSQGPSPVHATDRILKTSAARTPLLAIVTFATLLFSGCANGGYISTSGQHSSASFHQQNTFEVSGVPPDSYFVDFTKDPKSQTGPTYPLYSGLGTP
jgi:hypothetical protein